MEEEAVEEKYEMGKAGEEEEEEEEEGRKEEKEAQTAHPRRRAAL